MARYVAALAPDASRLFSLGDERRLGGLFAAAGFRDVEITTERHRFGVASFDEYFDPLNVAGGRLGRYS
jgi:hypothetical protein